MKKKILIMEDSIEVYMEGNTINYIGFIGEPPQDPNYDIWGEMEPFTKYDFDWSSVNDFQRRVLVELAKIPSGTVATYGGLAKRIGSKAPRAVGQALAKNPFSIIYPCHRVVGSTGKLTGFGGGLPWKTRLLRYEGREVEDLRLAFLPQDWR